MRVVETVAPLLERAQKQEVLVLAQAVRKQQDALAGVFVGALLLVVPAVLVVEVPLALRQVEGLVLVALQVVAVEQRGARRVVLGQWPGFFVLAGPLVGV